jgi:hypothetical protein
MSSEMRENEKHNYEWASVIEMELNALETLSSAYHPTSRRGQNCCTTQGHSSCLTEPTKNTSGLIRNEVEVRKTIKARMDEQD